jgi:chromosome segregation ATPase
MTDEELVKRLRDGATTYTDYLWMSADRIEELQQALKDQSSVSDRLAEANEKLTAERDEHWKSFVHWRKEADDRAEQLAAANEELCVLHREYEKLLTERIEELETKLNKAVEALRLIEADCEAGYPPSQLATKYTARATLAEIEGEKT